MTDDLILMTHETEKLALVTDDLILMTHETEKLAMVTVMT